MRKGLLLLALCLSSLHSFGQDPNFFKTWYLTEIAVDLEPSIFINGIEPSINPSITILEDLTFEGFGACNGFAGNFIYDENTNTVIAEEFVHTLVFCGISEHDQAENDYFAYLGAEDPLSITVTDTSLVLEFAPGFYLAFQNEPLAINDKPFTTLRLYPNPTFDQLFISSENTTIERVAIYDNSGKQVLNQSFNESAIDIAGLPSGMYFAEINSENGKAIQQFLKQYP